MPANMTPSRIHLMKVNAPRTAYLMGTRELVAEAQKQMGLPRGREGYVTFPGIGNITTWDIAIPQGRLMEIEEASAVQIVEAFGAELGEEGIPLDMVEGT